MGKRPRVSITRWTGHTPQPPQPQKRENGATGVIVAEGRVLDGCPVKLVEEFASVLLVEVCESRGEHFPKGTRLNVGSAEYQPY